VEEEENQPEENGFSNRHVSTTFIPPLTGLPTPALVRFYASTLLALAGIAGDRYGVLY
jgi:hypothetical protein